MSLINGTQISTALLADALVRARHLAEIADVAGAMTVEATKSSLRPFDARIQAVRPHPGQIACAANLRRLLADSEIMPSHANCSKVQDAYSVRCMPQVHGTLRDALTHVTRIVEMRNEFRDRQSAGVRRRRARCYPAATSTPSRSPWPRTCSRPPSPTCRASANGAIENLVNPDLSGLPGFLTPQPGLNSGMMLVQVLAAALVSENKSLSFPASVDSIPDLGQPRGPRLDGPRRGAQGAADRDQRRRVSWRARCCARPRDWSFARDCVPAVVSRRPTGTFAQHVRPLGRDRTLHRDLEAVERLIRTGSLLNAVEAVSGRLH